MMGTSHSHTRAIEFTPPKITAATATTITTPTATAGMAGTDEVMAFDFETFLANKAEVHIEGFDWETGETVAWTKADMPTMLDMMMRVRAVRLCPVHAADEIDGRTYMTVEWDERGEFARCGVGVTVSRRFFIVRTQPRGIAKALGALPRAVFRAAFRNHPLVAERTIERPSRYNALCDEVERLEQEGLACVSIPRDAR